MPASRNIVVSKDGYSTMSVSVRRSSFIEENNRMSASVSVTLAEEAAVAAAPVPSAAEPEAAAPELAPEAEAPEPVEAAPSEPSDAVAE
jgi:hypothetical protein